MDYDDYSYGCSSYGDDTYSYDEPSYEGYEDYAEDVYGNEDFDSTAYEAENEYLDDLLSSHMSASSTASQSHVERPMIMMTMMKRKFYSQIMW